MEKNKINKYIIYYLNHGELRSIHIEGNYSEMMKACSNLIQSGLLVSRVDLDE